MTTLLSTDTKVRANELSRLRHETMYVVESKEAPGVLGIHGLAFLDARGYDLDNDVLYTAEEG